MLLHKLAGVLIGLLVTALLFGPADRLLFLRASVAALTTDGMYTGRAITGILFAYVLPYAGVGFLIFPQLAATKLSPRSGPMREKTYSAGMFVIFGYFCLVASALVLYAFS